MILHNIHLVFQMTKTINWKKQRIERFKRENIKDDEDPDSLWKSPDKQTKVSFNETSPLPPNTQIIHQNCSVLNFYQLNAPNLHITSSTDDTKILQLKNAPVETYYPFQSPRLKEIELISAHPLQEPTYKHCHYAARPRPVMDI